MTKQTKSTFYRTLTSPYFLLSLALLVLNDHLFKYQFHNFLTGKISDFAGIFCFGLFFAGLFPKHAKRVLFVVGLFFLYWKSEFSTPFIQWFNQHTIFNYSRVVDYGDLFALVILPLAFFQLQKLRKTQFTLKMSPVLPLVLACIAFVATSDDEYVECCCYEGREFEIPFTNEVVTERMRENFFTETRGSHTNSRFYLLEYRTSICGHPTREQVTAVIIPTSDSTTVLEITDFCLSCDGFREEEEVIEDFHEQVVHVLRGN